MVAGLEIFREHFQEHQDAYVLIGGTACDAWMANTGLTFRKTKDIDIVLITETLERSFVRKLKGFISAGHYEVRQRHHSCRKDFYRFEKPKTAGYPAILELFAVPSTELRLAQGQRITPVTIGAHVSSLSAILMSPSYYELVLTNRTILHGLPLVTVDGLIPLKAKAWLDLTQRRDRGEPIDDYDIRKHRTDVFRLTLTLSAEPGPALADEVRADLQAFVSVFSTKSPEWPSIIQALRLVLRPTPTPGALLEAIINRYRLFIS